jgi:hypothetical protein
MNRDFVTVTPALVALISHLWGKGAFTEKDEKEVTGLSEAFNSVRTGMYALEQTVTGIDGHLLVVGLHVLNEILKEEDEFELCDLYYKEPAEGEAIEEESMYLPWDSVLGQVALQKFGRLVSKLEEKEKSQAQEEAARAYTSYADMLHELVEELNT